MDTRLFYEGVFITYGSAGLVLGYSLQANEGVSSSQEETDPALQAAYVENMLNTRTYMCARFPRKRSPHRRCLS